MDDLRAADVDFITIASISRRRGKHHPIERFV